MSDQNSGDYMPLAPPYDHHEQGRTCPRCGAARTPDGFCSACFQRGLPR